MRYSHIISATTTAIEVTAMKKSFLHATREKMDKIETKIVKLVIEKTGLGIARAAFETEYQKALCAGNTKSANAHDATVCYIARKIEALAKRLKRYTANYGALQASLIY